MLCTPWLEGGPFSSVAGGSGVGTSWDQGSDLLSSMLLSFFASPGLGFPMSNGPISLTSWEGLEGQVFRAMPGE